MTPDDIIKAFNAITESATFPRSAMHDGQWEGEQVVRQRDVVEVMAKLVRQAKEEHHD